MKILTFLLLILFTNLAFSQASNPNDTLKIGQAASVSDKGLIFETGDGASNKKLTIEDTFKLKFDGNKFQIGDGALTEDKELIFNGTSGKSVKYDFTNTEFSLNDDVAIDAGKKLKTNSIDAKSGTETAVEQDLRAKTKLFVGTSTNEIRVNAGNLEFSNDGSLYKKIGSGSGSGDGGVTLIENGSFEDGLTPGWTNSGGTFTQQTYTDGAEGEEKYARFVASAADQYIETTAVAVPDFGVGGCLAKINYNTSDVDNWYFRVYDGSANLLKQELLTVKNWQDGFASFPCPTIGTDVKMQIISIAAGQIEADKGYLGKENRTFQVNESKIAQNSYYAVATNCLWARTNTAYGDFGTDADCTAPISLSSSIGQLDLTDNDLPQWTINNLPAGKYLAHVSTPVQGTTTGSTSCLRLTDGTTNGLGACHSNSGTNPIFQAGIWLELNYSSSGSRTFKLQGKVNSGAIQIILNSATNSDGAQFILYRYPSESETALRVEAQGWMIDANIGGSTNPASTNTASPVGWNATTLDLVLNSGSSSAKIPCTGGNAPSGLTCSAGNEVLGAAFVNPEAGLYEACAYFTMSAQGTVSSTEWMEWTSLTDSTVVQLGKTRTSANMSSGSNQSTVTNCGTFYFPQVKERVLSLNYEANGTANTILLDRDASAGQRDVHIVIKPISTASDRPYLTGDQVITPNVAKPVLVSLNVSSAEVVSNDDSDFVTTCTDADPSVCSFTSSYWASAPKCWAQGTTAGDLATVNSGATTSSVSIDRATNGTPFALWCHGAKQ